MGGTFDVLHRGHRSLLKKAFTVGKTIVIGVTSDKFARSLHKPHKVDSYLSRKHDLEKLLKKWEVLPRARIVELTDRYGPTANDSKIEAIVVSKRTLKTARSINKQRRLKRFNPLEIVPIDLILAQDRYAISSTRIRRGRIDREGRLTETK